MRRGRSQSFAIRGIAWTRREHRSTSDGRDLHHDLLNIGRSWSSSRSAQHRTSLTSSGRTLRSRLDPSAIGEFAWWNRRQSSIRRSTNDQDHDRGAIVARSWRDRGPIAARSWPDRGPIAAKMQDIRRRNWSWFVAELKPRSSPQGTAPTTPSNNAHDRFQWPRFRA